MIAFVRGILVERTEDSAVVDVGGVGYNVLMSLSGIGSLPSDGTEVMLCTHTHVREDAFQLYGFSESIEKEAFRLLIAISGVGPRLAIQILGGISVPELIHAVDTNDLVRLKALHGVGKKTAERLLIDLRDKVGQLGGPSFIPGISGGATAGEGGSLFRDVRSALVNLGYKPVVVDKALEKMNDGREWEDFHVALREALSHLSRG
jgi:Holliday junction DNA helicase RuvA